MSASARGQTSMSTITRRVRREQKTVDAMLLMSCRARHGSRDGLCIDCRELMEYSHKRLERCPLIEHKPTCAKCTIHCYDKRHRDLMRSVMKHFGPRMLVRHPLLAVLHMLDGLRRPPDRRKRDSSPDNGHAAAGRTGIVF